jgi:hypothetical protein
MKKMRSKKAMSAIDESGTFDDASDFRENPPDLIGMA